MVSAVNSIDFNILRVGVILSGIAMLNLSTPYTEFFHISPVPDCIEAELKEAHKKKSGRDNRNQATSNPDDLGGICNHSKPALTHKGEV